METIHHCFGSTYSCVLASSPSFIQGGSEGPDLRVNFLAKMEHLVSMAFFHSTHGLLFYPSSTNIQNTTTGLMAHNLDEGMTLWKLKIDPYNKQALAIDPLTCI